MSRPTFAFDRSTAHALRLSSVTAEQWQALSAAIDKFGDDAHRVVAIAKGLDDAHYVYYLPEWLDHAICSLGPLSPVDPLIRDQIVTSVNSELRGLLPSTISHCGVVVPFRLTKVYCSSCIHSLTAAFLEQYDSRTSVASCFSVLRTIAGDYLLAASSHRSAEVWVHNEAVHAAHSVCGKGIATMMPDGRGSGVPWIQNYAPHDTFAVAPQTEDYHAERDALCEELPHSGDWWIRVSSAEPFATDVDKDGLLASEQLVVKVLLAAGTVIVRRVGDHMAALEALKRSSSVPQTATLMYPAPASVVSAELTTAGDVASHKIQATLARLGCVAVKMIIAASSSTIVATFDPSSVSAEDVQEALLGIGVASTVVTHESAPLFAIHPLVVTPLHTSVVERRCHHPRCSCKVCTFVNCGCGDEPAAIAIAATSTVHFVVEGMTCASCANNIERTLLSSEFIESATVNFATCSAAVTFDSAALRPEDVAGMISALGYGASLKQGGSGSIKAARNALERKDEMKVLGRRTLFAAVLTIPLMAFMLAMERSQMVMMRVHTIHVNQANIGDFIAFVIATLVLISGRQFFHRAVVSARHGVAGMDALIATAVGSAYLFSVILLILELANEAKAQTEFEAAAALIGFMLMGKWLEARAKRSTSDALLQLMSLAPSTCIRVKADGTEEEVSAEIVLINDLLRVPAGCRIPVDGVIEKGSASIDEQLITGESVPIDKGPGEKAIAGTLCLNADIYLRATSVGDETMLARILKVIQDAQNTKPSIQRLADKIAGVFVPVIKVFGITVLVVWVVLGYTDAYPAEWREGVSPFIFAFQFFLASIVVACPCALGLATPTAIMVGTGVGAKYGILVKDGTTLERGRSVNTVLFDKTGTLTTGVLRIAESIIVPSARGSDLSDEEIRRIVGTVESRSTHPIAAAITEAFGTVRTTELEVETMSGSGLASTLSFARDAGHAAPLQVFVGRPGFIKQCVGPDSFPTSLDESIQLLQSHGNTVIAAAIDGEVRILVGLSDTPKDTAAAAVSALHRRGIEVYMVSGDQPLAAKSIALQVGIPEDHVRSEVLPWEKCDVVKELQAQSGRVVCFVGDGLNDGPALTQADVGVAVGAGTEVAIDAADAVLIKNSLPDLITFFDLSGATIRRVYFNFIWASVYNACALPVAAGVFFPLWQQQLPMVIAGAMMVLSSLSVILSSLALKLFRPAKLQ